MFELEQDSIIPETKAELLNLLKTKMAIPFHWNICRRCHKVPGYAQWLRATDKDKMEVMAISKRQRAFSNWEPFYISDNREPPFDERLSWEGQSNKRIQVGFLSLLDILYQLIFKQIECLELCHVPVGL